MTEETLLESLKKPWPHKSLGEIAIEIIYGQGVTNSQLGTGDYPAIKNGDFHDQHKLQFNKCISFVNRDLIKKPKFCEYGDILISTRTTTKNIGHASVYLGKDRPVVGNNMLIIRHNQNGKFLSYIFSSKFVLSQIEKEIKLGTVAQLYKRHLVNIKIPLPPIHIQNKISDHLDTWINLEDQLKKELNLRKKQFEYYKEILFNSGIKRWEIISLKKITTEIFKGHGVAKYQIGTGDYPAIKCEDLNNTFSFSFTDCVKFVNENSVKRRKYFEYGDVLIGGLSNSSDRLGKTSVYLGKDKPLAGNNLFVIRHNQNGKFLSYALNSNYVKEQLRRNVRHGTSLFLTKEGIQKINVPLPSLEEQTRIVEILDKFHTITDSHKDGLPSLIEKYKKQYLYYKEQLLKIK